MRIALVLIGCLACQLMMLAQNTIISGYVEDIETGEKLPGAVIVEKNTNSTAISNDYGFYSLTLHKNDSVDIKVSYVGYASFQKSIVLNQKQSLNIFLKSSLLLKEVEIVGTQETAIEKRNEMSVVSIPINQVNNLPSIGGESDILKAVQLMPGVKAGNEGTSGLYVRGGSADQNLILLDDAPLYYVNHLGGFVSTFNTDALNNVKLIKGGFPAHYGSRLSSIIDVRMKEGNMKKFHASGMIGMIASKLSIEGPIKKDTTSYIISYRRMVYDLLTRPITKMALDGISLGYSFYDLNAKINHKLSEKDRLYLSIYLGDDKMISNQNSKNNNDKSKNTMQWGNSLAAIRWNHLYNQKLFSNVIITYTRYKFLTEFTSTTIENKKTQKSYFGFDSGISDFNAKIDFDYFAGTNYKIKFGANAVYHTFKPGVSSFKQQENTISSVDTSYGNYSLNAFEYAGFIENEIKLGTRFNSNIGTRLSIYRVNNKNFISLEPRILLSYLLAQTLSLKTSYAVMQQNVHLLSNSGLGLSTDLWLPATVKVMPSKSQQVALGLAKSVKNGLFEFSCEGYYKLSNNLITYQEGASLFNSSTDWQKKVETNGIGKSYGIELLMQKKEGKTTGWVGYTLSKTTRQFANISFGVPYLYKYDRTHDISLVLMHKWNDEVDISCTWVYGTGNPITLAVGTYKQGNMYTNIQIYNGVNSFRMRAYHRMDIGINFHKQKKWGERTWNVSVYNLYNRQNPYYYYFDTYSSLEYMGVSVPDKRIETKVLQQKSLFPIIPSISYSFKF